MKKIFSLLLCAFALFSTMNAEEITYDFSSSIPNGWTASANPNGFETTGSARGAQFTQNATLTLSGSKGISKVVITCSSNVADKNTIAVKVNGTTFGKTETLAKETDVDKTFTGTATDGDLVITLTRGDKSVWIKQIVVTCTEGGNTGGDDNNNELGKDLDPNYVYPDIVKITAPTDQFYNQPCTFVQKNVEIKCSKSTHQNGYFSCAAGETMSITATQPFVALTINGTVKKNFEASANNGSISYVYNEEEEVTQNPVIFIDQINANTVTLSCLKQVQCTEITIYFKEAPELDLDALFGEDEEEELYSYEWESTTPVALTPTFDELGFEYYDVEFTEELSIPFVDMYLDNDDEELVLQFIAEHDPLTGVAPGTYPISSELDMNVVVASVGGDEFNDYPSILISDFDVVDGETQYSTVFYLVSGTVTVSADPAGVKVVVDALTHFGSTIKTTYVGPMIDYNEVEAIDTVVADAPASKNGKFIRNGKLYIERDGRLFNALGVNVR